MSAREQSGVCDLRQTDTLHISVKQYMASYKPCMASHPHYDTCQTFQI